MTRGRLRTDAAERTAQNHRLVEAVSEELGRPVTVREAQAHRRAQRAGLPSGDIADLPKRSNAPKAGGGVAHLIEDSPVDLDDEEVEFIGLLKAKVEDFRMLRGTTAVLNLTTSREFRHLLVDAATVSRADLLVVVMYRIPRDLGLEDDEREDDD